MTKTQPVYSGMQMLGRNIIKSGQKMKPDDIIDNITKCSDGPEGSKGTVQYVVLNACESKKLTESLHKAGVKYVLSWETLVDDVAARTFASSLYEYLGGCRGNSKNFIDAYDGVVRDLKNRGWLLLDLTNKKVIKAKQIDEQNPSLKAAGIPCIFLKKEIDTKLEKPPAPDCPTHTISIFNDITSWPSDDNEDFQVSIECDKFLEPKNGI